MNQLNVPYSSNQVHQQDSDIHPSGSSTATQPGADRNGAIIEAQVAVDNQLADYGFRSLWRKFWNRPLSERWSYFWCIVRGILRSRQINSAHLIMMGSGVIINKRNGYFTTGGVCMLRPSCRIAIVSKNDQPAHLHIGPGAEIGDRTIINVSQRIEIGARCSISWDCDISDSDFHQVILPDGQRPPITEPVIIEDDVWIGSHCLILKGVTIGHHSVIAAGSVVRRDVPPYSLVAGNPARNIGQVTGWQR